MSRLLTITLVATLLHGCASMPPPASTPPAPLPAPLPTWPLAGCTRTSSSPPRVTLLCEDSRLLVLEGNASEVARPASPLPTRDLLADRLFREEGYTARQPVRLALPGGEVEALRLTASAADTQAPRVAYVAERPRDLSPRAVSCALPKDTPEGRARCERLMDAILRYGPSHDEPGAFVAAKLEALLGGKVALPEDCELVGANSSEGAARNGSVVCKERLVLTWSAGSAGRTPAKEYARMREMLQRSVDEAGGQVEWRACTLRGGRVPCVHFALAGQAGRAPEVGYLGLSREEPELLISCMASEGAPPLRALCERLFAPEPPLPVAQLAANAERGSLYVDETHVFYGAGSSVVRQPKAGGPPRVLVQPDGASGDVRRVTGSGPELFFATQWALYRVPKAGGEAVALSKDLRADEELDIYRWYNEVRHLAVDSTFVYVALGRRLVRVPRAGGAALALESSSEGALFGVLPDGTAIHASDGGGVKRMGRTGGTPTVLATLSPKSAIQALAQDEQSLYAVVGGEVRGLFRIDKRDGRVTLLGRTDQPRDVAVDQDSVYVADVGVGLLHVSKRGGSLEMLLPTPCNSVALDDTSLYVVTVEKGFPTPLVRLAKPRPSRVPDPFQTGLELTCEQGSYEACMRDCGEGRGAACLEAATPHLDGRGGFPEDMKKGFALVEQGCQASLPSARACSLLGFSAYHDDETFPQGEPRGLELMARGCELDAKECGGLAEVLLMDGADFARAFALHQRACDGGSASSCDRVARELREGRRVPRDEQGAQRARDRACALDPKRCEP